MSLVEDPNSRLSTTVLDLNSFIFVMDTEKSSFLLYELESYVLGNLNCLLKLIDIGGSKNITLTKKLCKFNFKEFQKLVLGDSKDLAWPSQKMSSPLASIPSTPILIAQVSNIQITHSRFQLAYITGVIVLHHFQIYLSLCHSQNCKVAFPHS